MLLFLALVLWIGEPGVGLGLHTPQGNLCSRDSSLDSQLALLGVGPACFMSSPFLPVLMWLFLYVLTYRSSVQLVFRWFYRLTVL